MFWNCRLLINGKLTGWVLEFGSTSINFSDSTRAASGGVVTYTWDTPAGFSISDGDVLDISITGMACDP